MLDLMAITAGVLSFTGWSAAMFGIGILNQRRRERERQLLERQRFIREVARVKAAKAPEKVEPRYPAASADVRRRAQA